MVSVNDFACVRATVILNVIGIGSGHHSVPCVNAIKELLVSLSLLQVLLFLVNATDVPSVEAL